LHQLRNSHLLIDDGLVKFQRLRERVDAAGDLISGLTLRLPKERDFPDLYEVLRM
jgi:hypothetical protein